LIGEGSYFGYYSITGGGLEGCGGWGLALDKPPEDKGETKGKLCDC
jgi:hypothetical protein